MSPFLKRNKLLIGFSGLLFCVVAGVWFILAWNPDSLTGQTRDFRPIQVVKAFPAITKFPVKSVREAGDSLNPTELVLGVTVGKESRAYPINMLTGPQREILNDTLGGKAIAATW